MRKSLCVIMALVLALCLSPVAMAEDYTATAKGLSLIHISEPTRH